MAKRLEVRERMILFKIATKKMLLMPWTGLWMSVWNFSERAGISLGRFAPFVFNQAIGAYGKSINIERLEGGDCHREKNGKGSETTEKG